MRQNRLQIFAVLCLIFCSACRPEEIKKTQVSLQNTPDLSGLVVGDSLRISAQADDSTAILYWKQDAEVIAEGNTLELFLEEAGTFQFEADVRESQEAIVAELTVEVAPLRGGALVLNEGVFGATNGSVSFLPEGSDRLRTSLYSRLNQQATLGQTVQSATYFNDKLYLVSVGGPNYITVVDADNFKVIDSLTNSAATLNRPTHLTMVSETVGYLRDTDGLHKVDLAAKSVTVIDRAFPANDQHLLIDDQLYFYNDTLLRKFDPATDQLIDDLVFKASVGAMTQSRDGNIWLALGTTPATLVEVSTADFRKIRTVEMPESFDFTAGWKAFPLLASPVEDALFVMPYQGYNVSKTITKVDVSTDTPTTETLADLSQWSDEELGMVYGQPGIDPVSGNLYVTGIKGYEAYSSNALFVINGNTGAQEGKVTDVGEFPAMVLCTQ